MVVFGWLVLAALALCASLGTLLVFFGTLGLTGKVGGETVFFAVIAGLLIWASCANFPFTVGLA